MHAEESTVIKKTLVLNIIVCKLTIATPLRIIETMPGAPIPIVTVVGFFHTRDAPKSQRQLSA